MRYIADLHTHSLYSRATSKASHLRGLAVWAAVKGIDVVATGDFTHPAWFAHIHNELVAAEEGLFRLKPDPLFDYAALLPAGLWPGKHPEDVRFILSAEISCIYKRGGRVRKVHNLLYAPDLEAVGRINTALANLGNINADGRPILGLDSRDLLELVLEKAPEAFLVPAHIWTPWFSLFGSKSGFDRIEDCFADLSEHIFALETGLSSDPAMNRTVSALDRYTLISNSDCHSPAKLGREANILDTGLDYFSLREALRHPCDGEGRQRFLATVEFFPEEGKYHSDGHRKCGVCLEPRKTQELAGLCPVCGKELTVGVLHRVLELADRSEPLFPPCSPEVYSLMPLAEIVAELVGVGAASKKVGAAYARLIRLFSSEFQLLLETPLEDIHSQGLPLLAEAIARVRNNEVIRQPGYDGVFGIIRVFSEGERTRLAGQQNLFAKQETSKKIRTTTPADHSLAGKKRTKARAEGAGTGDTGAESTTKHIPESALNNAQLAAVMSSAPRIVVQAGPGTGKTHTLVSRVERLLQEGRHSCTVITFTNKAADELRQRLHLQDRQGHNCRIATFHGFCLELLRCRQPNLLVVGPDERAYTVAELYPDLSRQKQRHCLQEIANYLQTEPGLVPSPEVQGYLEHLAQRTLIDLDGICWQILVLLRQDAYWATRFGQMCGQLFVDEFQDVNAVQYALVAELAVNNPVFVIGDPNQAIYGFRGASPRWFYRFLEEFGAEYHSLTQNYRSGAALVTAATAVIRHNPQPLQAPAMEAMATMQARLHLQECASPEAEARFIADHIEAQLGGLSHRGLERLAPTAQPGVSFGDIAVLYRTRRQAAALHKVFAERGIPCQQVDLEAYYMHGPCRLLYAWLMLLSGRATLEELLFLLGQEPGIGAVRLGRLHGLLKEKQPGQIQAEPLWFLPLLREVGAVADSVPAAFVRLLEQMAKRANEVTLHALLDMLLEALARHYDGFDADEKGLVRLRQSALPFAELAAFAVHLERYSDSVQYDAQAAAITLSTLHAAKGLEFAVVFLCGCEQDVLPLAPREALSEAALAAHVEEERRLFYVGMTRARSTLYCTWCRTRQGFAIPGQQDASSGRHPSPFLAEFSPDLLSPVPIIQGAGRKTRPVGCQLSLFFDKR